MTQTNVRTIVSFNLVTFPVYITIKPRQPIVNQTASLYFGQYRVLYSSTPSGPRSSEEMEVDVAQVAEAKQHKKVAIEAAEATAAKY